MKSIFDFFSRSVKSSMTIYENQIKAQFSKVKNVEKGIRKQIRKAFQSVVAFIFGKPSSVKDYFRISKWYVSKRFVLKVVFILIVFVLVLIYGIIPFLSGKLWVSSLTVNSDEYHQFSGKCKVFKEDGSLLYIGTLEDGVIVGSGELYDDDKLVYKGDFEKNKFNGNGTLFENGILLYKGEFTNNSYNGKGTLYFTNGNVLFDGEFENGEYKNGIEYYEDGRKKYEGNFANSVYDGEAKLYADDEENTVLFKGAFGNGKYNGKGKLYEGGSLKYEGDFVDGKYNGKGQKYEKGVLIYDGEFSDGKYNGEGSLFSSKNGKIIYEGSFSDEKYEGEGTLYGEESGKLLYKGGFSEGLYSEKGALYSEETGRVIYDGNFVKSLYDGEGILYSENGKKLFNGSFFEGKINYMDFFNQDIEYIRQCFGKEDSMETFDTSFDIIYNDLNIIFEFDYSEDDENKPMFSKIKFFGEQEIEGISKGAFVKDINEKFKEESFTAYNFAASPNEVSMNGHIDHEITEGMALYSVKYLFDDYYIRVYSLGEDKEVLYFEMGGI